MNLLTANETSNEHLCSFYDEEDCLYVYVYSYNESQHLHIRAQKEHECPRKVFYLQISSHKNSFSTDFKKGGGSQFDCMFFSIRRYR